jgi:hypothetical protein
MSTQGKFWSWIFLAAIFSAIPEEGHLSSSATVGEPSKYFHLFAETQVGYHSDHEFESQQLERYRQAWKKHLTLLTPRVQAEIERLRADKKVSWKIIPFDGSFERVWEEAKSPLEAARFLQEHDGKNARYTMAFAPNGTPPGRVRIEVCFAELPSKERRDDLKAILARALEKGTE